MKSCQLYRICAVMSCVFCLVYGGLLKAAEAESGIMLCTDNKNKSVNLIVRPALLNAQKNCDGQGIWEQVKTSNSTYEQCLSVNIACLIESSPNFQRTIEQVAAVNETGEVSPVIEISGVANAAIKERAGMAVSAFLATHLLYSYAYAGAGFFDSLIVSLLSAGFLFVRPETPAYIWSVISPWLSDLFAPPQAPGSNQATKGAKGTENYGSSSNTFYGKNAWLKSAESKQVRNNVHKLDFPRY